MSIPNLVTDGHQVFSTKGYKTIDKPTRNFKNQYKKVLRPITILLGYLFKTYLKIHPTSSMDLDHCFIVFHCFLVNFAGWH